MAVKKKNLLKDLIYKFNSLPEEKQFYFLKCMETLNSVEINNIYSIVDEEDIILYKSIRENIFDLIARSNNQEDTIAILVKNGLDVEASKILFEYFDYLYEPCLDVDFINKLDKVVFKEIVVFTIDNLVIYKNYQNFLINNFVTKFKLENSEMLNKILRFVIHHAKQIGEYETSPDLLKNILITEFSLHEELADILINSITQKLDLISKASYFEKLSNLEEKIEKIDTFFETLDNKIKSKTKQN